MLLNHAAGRIGQTVDLSQVHALSQTIQATRFAEVFSPFRPAAVDRLLYGRASPVRLWTLAGALLGMASGFALAILTALVNRLIVGGKPRGFLHPQYNGQRCPYQGHNLLCGPRARGTVPGFGPGAPCQAFPLQ
jgi:hypothetical protein